MLGAQEPEKRSLSCAEQYIWLPSVKVSNVVIAQEALSLEKYVKATHYGRGTRLDRKKSMQIWKVFENCQSLMKENSWNVCPH